MLELSQIDRDILCELDHDSRQSVAELSRKLRFGRERLAYRIKKLEERGIIRRFTTSVNPYKFGLIVYKTYLQLESNKKRLGAFLDYLNNHSRVYWFAECVGTWDLMFAISSKNPKEFHTIQSEILSRFRDIIVGFSVYTIVEASFFRKAYLRGFGSASFPFGGEPSNHALTELDFNILKVLSQNSRLTAIEIADQIHSSPAMVRRRIQRLEELQIIVGYRVELDLEKLGMSFMKAQLHLRNYDARIEEELKEYCKANPHIILYIQQIGDCRVELEFEVHDHLQFNGFIDEVREKFSRYIRRVDSIMIRKETYKWMPIDIVRDSQKSG